MPHGCLRLSDVVLPELALAGGCFNTCRDDVGNWPMTRDILPWRTGILEGDGRIYSTSVCVFWTFYVSLLFVGSLDTAISRSEFWS